MLSGGCANKIGLARRRMWYAIWLAGMMFIISVIGCSKILLKSNCEKEVVATMCTK